jgi:4-hydroxybenzoate polyprenyltransferase
MNSIPIQSPPSTIAKYLSMVRFSHTIFALPFALLATWWAYVVPLGTDGATTPKFEWIHLFAIILCMVFARSFAMAINRLLDQSFDAANPRTAGRHLPAGQLTRTGVWGFAWINAAFFIASCALFLPNRLPLILAIPVLAFLGMYSWTKRFTQFAHYWLGVALMLAPICAWIAIRGSSLVNAPLDLIPAAWLGSVVLFWVAGFDIIYACQDFEFDRRAGLHSIPAKFGISGAMWIARGSHLVMWLLAIGLSFACPELNLGWLYRIGICGVGILLLIEHSVVSHRSLERINLAFFQLNSIISVVFLIAGGLDAWTR